MGDGLCFRKHSFDGAISVSAVQWLCFQTKPEHEPEKRLRKFFRGLHAVLAPNARAALQVYPEQPAHMEMMRRAALGAGFAGMVVVDYPVSERSKKLFLVLVAAPRPLAPRKALGAPGNGGGRGGGGEGFGRGARRQGGAKGSGRGGGGKGGTTRRRRKGGGKGGAKRPRE